MSSISPYTTDVGSITDRPLVRRCMAGVRAVFHAATLLKPHVASYSPQDFVEAKVTGTLSLLDASVDPTDARNDILRCFGRSDRRALCEVEGSRLRSDARLFEWGRTPASQARDRAETARGDSIGT